MLSSLRLGAKLMLAPAVVLVLMCGGAWFASRAIDRQGDALEHIVLARAAQTRSAAELAANARQAHSEVYQLLTWISASFSAARTDTLVRGIHRRHAAIERNFTALARVTAGGSAEAALVRQADGAWRAYLASVLDVIALARSDQSISANAMTRTERAFDTVLLRLDGLTRLEQLLSERVALQASDDAHTVTTLMPAVLMAAIALALSVTLAVRRVLQGELNAIEAAAVALGEGDLHPLPPVRGRDEICSAARTLADARATLNHRVQDVLDATRSLAADAHRLDDGGAVHAQALALARTVMAFRLAPPPPRQANWRRKIKGMPAPSRRGHPYLRLASSRPRTSRN